MALSADGTLLACKNGTGITIYSTATGTPVGTYAANFVDLEELALAKTYATDGTWTGTKLAFVTTDKLSGDTKDFSDVFTWTNAIPVANADSTDVDEDTTLASITVLGNDSDTDDTDNTVLTAVKASDPAHGTVTLNGDNRTFTYQPNANYNGPDSFTYQAKDPAGMLSAPATVTINITSVNDAPVITNAPTTAMVCNEDTLLTPFVLTASDIDKDTLTWSVGEDASHGTATVSAVGVVSYTPAANYCGGDSFTVTVDDQHGGTASATITVTVNPVNDMPTFAKGADVTVDEDSLAYDAQWATDVWAGDKGDTYEDDQTLTMSATLNNGADLFDVTPKFVVNKTNHTANLQFTPKPNAYGTASVTVNLSDNGTPVASAVPATFNINITPVNDPPSFTMGADQVVDEDCDPQSVSGWAKDISAGPNETGQTVTFTVTNDNNALFLVQPMIDPTGTLTYNVNPDANGKATVTVVSNDTNNPPAESAAQTFTITVKPVNDAPTADTQSVTTDEDTAKAITLTGSDIDSAGLTYSIVSVPSDEAGTLSDVTGDKVTFTPAANFNGTATFTYKANDGALDSAAATVTITVKPVNDTPTADTQSVTTDEDTAKAITLTGSDIDKDALTFKSVSAPQKGVLVLNPDGTGTYTPNANANGDDSFTFVVNDKTVDSAPATVTIHITPVNDAPMITNAPTDPVVCSEDGSPTPFALTLTATDVENETLTWTVGNASNGTTAVTQAGIVSYTPAENYSGSDSFTVTVDDGPQGGTASATINVTVNPVNDAPTAADVSAETNEDTSATITLKGSDIDSAGLTYSIVSGPSDEAGTLSAIDGNKVTFTPTANFNGTATFTYKVYDGEFYSGTAMVTITVKPVNDAPVLSSISAKSTYRNVALTDIPLTVTDVDDLTAVQMSWTPKDASGIVQDVTFSGTARMAITPALDKVGTTIITITATDGSGVQSSQDVTVTVKQTYFVTPIADLGGTISPDTNTVVMPNGYVFFTATPDKTNNYGVDTWYVKDAPVQIGGLTYDLSKINADTTVKVTFKKDYPAPTVDTVTGFNNPQENVGQAAITITGSNFRSGASVYLTNGDELQTVTAADVVVNADGTRLTCSFNLTRNATDRPWALVVTNDDGKSVTKSDVVTLTAAAPHLRSITPATGQTRQSVSVEVIGYGFDQNATVQLQRPGKTSVPFATTFFDKTRLLGTVTLPETDAPATADVWNVVVVNGDNTFSTDPVSFTVGPNPAPTITTMSPVSVRKQANGTGTANLTITGTGFSVDASVMLHPDGIVSTGSDVMLPTPTMTTATQLDWTGVDITGIPTGQWDVIVTNADGQSATLKDGLTVLPAGLTAVALSVNRPDPQPYGCTLTLTAAKTGSAQNVEYAFYAKRLNSITQQWIVTQLRGYGAATFDWKPDMPANYYLYATAREVNSGVEYQVISPETFYRIQDGSITSVGFSFTRNAITGVYTLKGSVTGTAKNVEYRFVGYLKDPVTGKLTNQNIRGYGMADECEWTPPSSGTYLLGVLARVVGSTSSYDKQSPIMPYQIIK